MDNASPDEARTTPRRRARAAQDRQNVVLCRFARRAGPHASQRACPDRCGDMPTEVTCRNHSTAEVAQDAVCAQVAVTADQGVSDGGVVADPGAGVDDGTRAQGGPVADMGVRAGAGVGVNTPASAGRTRSRTRRTEAGTEHPRVGGEDVGSVSGVGSGCAARAPGCSR